MKLRAGPSGAGQAVGHPFRHGMQSTAPFRQPNRGSPLRRAVSCAASVADAQTAPPTVAQLPTEVQSSTAVVSAAGATVYILGMSHVSRTSCQHIRELITAVQPDTVLVELCKDRTGLLVDPTAPPPKLWHAGHVCLTGALPTAAPPQAAFLEGLKTQRGEPVGVAEIEDDVATLLSSGLFRSVKPVTKPPSPTAAPSFLVRPTGKLQVVAPLGVVEFTVVERTLPAVTTFGIAMEPEGLAGVGAESAAAATALALANSGAPALGNLLQARAALLAALPADLNVELQGVESGKVTALVGRVPPGQQRSLTGLEASAAGGKGWGIDAYQRQPQRTPGGALTGVLGKQPRAAQREDADTSAASSGRSSGSNAEQVTIRPWTAEELQHGAEEADDLQQGGLQGAFASALTQTYARFQASAGRTVGIPPGAAWRIALEEAAACGARQVVLGDVPAGVTASRLGESIWVAWAPFLLGALPAAAASALIMAPALTADGVQGAAYAVAAAAAFPLGLAVAPILGPLLEVWRFSLLSAADIEEAVRVKEPLQGAAGVSLPLVKLWGEDALLSWPGALPPVIEERDEFMASAIAAQVVHSQGLTPAYVRSSSADGRVMFRYAMPQGGDAAVCPRGQGDGEFRAAGGVRRVVAVVGTAHVRGMVEAWGRVTTQPGSGDV